MSSVRSASAFACTAPFTLLGTRAQFAEHLGGFRSALALYTTKDTFLLAFNSPEMASLVLGCKIKVEEK